MKFVPFYTPIWQFQTSVDTAELLDKCKNVINNIKGVSISNKGGYHSELIELPKEFPGLWETISQHIHEVSTDLNLPIYVSGAWVNCNPQYSYNTSHSHPGHALSGVLYVDCNKDSGSIVFENPTDSTIFPVDSTHPTFYGTYIINPSPGMLLVFPSYLKHRVEINNSSQDRWSIAINFQF